MLQGQLKVYFSQFFLKSIVYSKIVLQVFSIQKQKHQLWKDIILNKQRFFETLSNATDVSSISLGACNIDTSFQMFVKFIFMSKMVVSNVNPLLQNPKRVGVRDGLVERRCQMVLSNGDAKRRCPTALSNGDVKWRCQTALSNGVV